MLERMIYCPQHARHNQLTVRCMIRSEYPVPEGMCNKEISQS